MPQKNSDVAILELQKDLLLTIDELKSNFSNMNYVSNDMIHLLITFCFLFEVLTIKCRFSPLLDFSARAALY